MQRLRRFLLSNASTKQIVVKNTFWIGISTTLVKIVRAAIIIYAARLLGTGDYGVFTYALSIGAIFASIADIGLTSILTREIAKHSDKANAYFSTAFVLKLCMLLAMSILIVVVGPLVSRFPGSSALMPIVALSLVFESLRTFLYAIPRSKNRMQTEAALSITNELFCALLIIALFLNHPTPRSLALSFMIGNGIGLLIAAASMWRHIVSVSQHFVKSLFLPLARFTLPFAMIGIFGLLMTNVDSLILGFFGSEHTLGLFGAAQRPISILYVIPNFLAGSLLPIISRFLAEGKKDTVRSLASMSAVASVIVALPLVLGGMVIAGPFMNVVFGYAYSGATLTLQLLLTTLLFVFPGTMFAEILLAENKQKLFLYTSIAGGLANIGLDLVLIPRYSIAGSAVATIVAQIIVNTWYYLALRRVYDIRLFRGIYKSVIASLIMAAAAYLLVARATPLIAIVPIAGLLYVGLLFVLRDRTALELLRTIRAR